MVEYFKYHNGNYHYNRNLLSLNHNKKWHGIKKMIHYNTIIVSITYHCKEVLSLIELNNYKIILILIYLRILLYLF